MAHYLVFLSIAGITILSPGPGVILTLTNALHRGAIGALPGILGIALGALALALASATSVGIILASSVVAFTIMKYVGAVYLVYLGIKFWRKPKLQVELAKQATRGPGKRFSEALALQLTNPKAVFFFMSIFPQFIDETANYAPQFLGLALTYSGLVVAIHFGYALVARQAKQWIFTPRGERIVSRAVGAAFILFGAAMASSSK